MRIKEALKSVYHALPASYILMLHHVSSDPENKKSCCVLATSRFVELLDRDYNFCTVEEAVCSAGKRNVAVTFDDGLLDVFTLAYPILKSRNIPFTVFIATDLIGQDGYISQDQLKTLANDPLVTVGSHGVTHEVLTALDHSKACDEIASSKTILEDWIGKEIRLFAYSHGQSNQLIQKCVLDHYECAFSAGGKGLNLYSGRNKATLPRLNITDETFGSATEFLDRHCLAKR